MLFSDIKDDVKQVVGLCDDQTLWSRTTHAIEVLANKGQWDSLTGYLDIIVTNRVITLPRQVEIPIKINIDNNPSFSRGQLYEFSLNGPRNDMQDTSGWSWMNKGEVPVFVQPNNKKVFFQADNSGDDGQVVVIEGLDVDNKYIKDQITLNFATPNLSGNTYIKIEHIHKPLTVGAVTLKEDITNTVLGIYGYNNLNPMYRQILLNVDAEAVKIFYRRKTFSIMSDNDFIPLQSAMSLLMMLMSLEEFRKGADFQKAQAYEAQALKFLQEEQVSRNNFETVKNTEIQPMLDLGYANADSVIVADMYDEACSIFGPIGRSAVFDQITDGLTLLSNKGPWDGTIGYVDIVVNNGIVTLPRYVDSVMALNICGRPTQMRNKWYEFHINGWGSGTTPCGYWDPMDEAVTMRPLTSFVQLVAQPDSSADDGKTMTIYGRDKQGKELGGVVDGEWVAGLVLTMDHLGPQPVSDATQISYIERVVKDTTLGYVQLQAFDPVAQQPYLLGFYHPDETEPRYRRIKLPNSLFAPQVRIRYKKRSLKVNSLTEPLHLRSKLSLSAAMRAVNALRSGDLQNASAFEALAVRYLEEDQIAHNPGEVVNFQVVGFNRSRVII